MGDRALISILARHDAKSKRGVPRNLISEILVLERVVAVRSLNMYEIQRICSSRAGGYELFGTT